jgi:hypothetical protein
MIRLKAEEIDFSTFFLQRGERDEKSKSRDI